MGGRPRLVLVSEDSPGEPHLSRLAGLLPGLTGLVDFVVLRWKQTAAREIVECARGLASLSPRPGLTLSERFDLARAAGLAGVQLPEDGLAPTDVRRCWPEAVIGVSRHDAAGVADRSAGADFVLLAPVFETASKPDSPELGLAAFADIAAQSPVAVLALGGVDEERIPDLLRAGAAGVAVRSAILHERDPLQAARRLRAALDGP